MVGRENKHSNQEIYIFAAYFKFKALDFSVINFDF